jgi:hypothetical protein
MAAGPEPLLKSNPYMTMEQVNYWGKYIDSLDVYDHLLSCHNYNEDDLFKNESWTNYEILQGPKTLIREKLSEGLLDNRHPEKPLYAQETLWPGKKYHPGYSPDDIRKNAIVIIMSGAMINYSDMDGNSSSGFSVTLDFKKMHPEIHKAIHHVWDFFESVPFCQLKPRQYLVNNGYCLAKTDEIYLVYLPEVGEVKVDFRDTAFDAQWISGRNTDKKLKIAEITE